MASKQPPITDRTQYLTDIAFIPPEFKNEVWAAQSLFYAKKNSVRFLDPIKAEKYRNLSRGIINEAEYKKIIDPVTPTGHGGKAEYVASDWKTCPVDVHLDNIVETKLDKAQIENKIQLNTIDKFAKSQKQRKKEKILWQRETRNLINELHAELGYNPIKGSVNPYSYIKEKSGDSENMTEAMDQTLEYIESQIKDSQDLALYDRYLYKGDIEIAFELGIEHLLVDVNKWRIWCKSFNQDILHFNRACGQWITDQTTGRGMVRYIDPQHLWTSPFKTRNGEDILFWWNESDITWAEFFQTMGQTLNQEQLKAVFQLNKDNGNHNYNWGQRMSISASNARIRVGRCEFLTQDSENFSQNLIDGKVPAMKRQPLSWMPNKYTPSKYKSEQVMKVYNVWYSWDYIPPPGSRLDNNSPADWTWQSQYIFNLKKNVDMHRYGVDQRYAKSTLVIQKDERMSFTDVKEAFMTKIRTLWHKMQNNLVQDFTSIIMDQDFTSAMLSAVDESNKTNAANPNKPSGGTGKDAGIAMFKSIKQGGVGMIKLRDKNGQIAIQDPSKLFFSIDSGHATKAGQNMESILGLYSLMITSLSQNDITEGKAPAPRTPVVGLEEAITSSKEGIWFIEDAVREFFIMFGERTVQQILLIVQDAKKYGYSKRFNELRSVIGIANAMLLEAVEDLTPEEIGLTVSLENTKANQEYVISLATQMADKGEIGRDVVGILIDLVHTNYKYAYVLLMIETKRRKEEMAAQEELAHKRQMELAQVNLQTAVTLTQATGAAKDQNIRTKGEVDSQLQQLGNSLKAETMQKQKQQLKDNRIEQDNNKNQNQQQSRVQEAMAGV